ncbi:hypothetical protein MLD38_034429 [Melastoma candidum]|uniref:Uncharacterized protein n=1 Tax=Melastoma candidum TaxID=119954 RepID=A0ACB9ME22_9MYRT|nr:hypothetical protein MLD38_034429 [Melastoma candidum]
MLNLRIIVNLALATVVISLAVSSRCRAQQSYSGNAVMDCDGRDVHGPSPIFLYTCNGRRQSCHSFLTFKPEPPYNSVPTIAALLSSDEDGLARANDVTKLAVFPANQEVIVPVNCSCSGWYYEAMTSYPMVYTDYTDDRSSYFWLANDTFQGLSTCDSLVRFNGDGRMNSSRGGTLRVPLRCACPTRNQTRGRRKIAERFGVSVDVILKANGFSEWNPTIYPFTTILIPLAAAPSISKTVIQEHQPPPFHPPSTKQKSDKKLVWAVGISAIFAVILFTGMFLACFVRRGKVTGTVLPVRCEKKRKKLFSPADLRVEIASLDEVLKRFNYEDVRKATRNFSSRKIIHGSVYRGLFGQELLAVKKLVRDASKEVRILKKLNHINLISLKGFCQFKDCSFLVFEYMSNGSLKQWLSNNKSKRIASWSQRIQIALDVANGLHYLHSYTKPGYIHGDVNSDNILLNRDLRAKITNFSLARAIDKQSSTSSTSTPKFDVYTFGVVMLEALVGEGVRVPTRRRGGDPLGRIPRGDEGGRRRNGCRTTHRSEAGGLKDGVGGAGGEAEHGVLGGGAAKHGRDSRIPDEDPGGSASTSTTSIPGASTKSLFHVINPGIKTSK